MRNTSLYIAKVDGTREVLDQVTLEMAREIFSRLDWEAEREAAEAAMDEGRETYVPEFGLTEEDGRMLGIEPTSSESVTFYFQLPDYWWQLPDFPKSEVAGLLDLFFAGDDDAIKNLCARSRPEHELQLHELSDAEFEATKAAGMRRIGPVKNQVPLREYLRACIDQLSLQTSLETIELTDIFRSADERHTHILFNYGDPATALVLVVKQDPDQGDSILGHHFVSLAVSDDPP